jgi:hypothetical protein
MLFSLIMVLVAYASYRLGKALWVRAVGRTWYILPALVAYIVALWLLLTATTRTRGGALLFAAAIFAGVWVNDRMRRRSQARSRAAETEARD